MRRLPPMGALEAFVVVAQNRTLRAASEQLNLSVSALSRRIQALETYIGVPLFERLHHELRLTEQGEWLRENAVPAFDRLAHMLDDLQQSGARHLTIGVAPAFAASWLLPRIADFRASHPDIDLSFDSSGKPFAKLGGSLDAAIVFAEEVAGDLYARVLKPQAAFAVAPPGRVAPGTNPAEVFAQDTLLVHGGLPKVLPLWLSAMGLDERTPSRIETYDSGPMLLGAVEAGLGIAITLEDSVRFYEGGGRLERPFSEAVPTPYSYHFVCKRSALTGRALRRFHEWLFAQR